MKKEKDYTIHLIIFILIISCLASCGSSYIKNKDEGYVPAIIVPGKDTIKFTAGEIIYPDAVHEDTLIVIDPVELNSAISLSDSDWKINEALHRYCAILNQPIPEYGMDVDNKGYHLRDNCYGDTISARWGTNFDSLIYKWND